jgi:O-antigen/teichoic acid export membrane protein
MGALINEILTHLLGQYVDGAGAIIGIGFAFSFWCFDWAIIEWRRRRISSAMLWVAGTLIIILVLIPAWNRRSLIFALVIGLVYYWIFKRADQSLRRSQRV